MDTFEKIKKSWWVLFPLTIVLPGFGFIYIGMKSSNKNWILEGITYELPFFFYILASTVFNPEIIARYYIWIIFIAVFVALIRSIMVAIKLFDIYDLDETPKVTTVPASNANDSKASKAVNKVRNKSNFDECCCCVVAIFIIFAVITIL